MNALAFLVRKQIKNYLLDLIRRPARLVVTLCAAGLLVMMLVSSQKGSSAVHGYTDIRLLHGIFLGWLLLIGVPSLLSALKSGTTVFKMSDVNFLFVSPIPPKKILTYGLLKQIVNTLFGFIFLLFYSGMLMQNFRITIFGVVLLVAGSVAYMCFIEVLSLLIYSFSNGKPARQKAVKSVLYLFLAAIVFTVLTVYLKNGCGKAAAFAAVSSPYLEYFPVVGWAKGAVFALISGSTAKAALYGGLFLISFFLCLFLFEKSDADYYEDVLQNTETRFEVQRAAKEKRVAASSRSGRKIRVGRKGIGRGWGANVFFYKHLCEARRRSRFLFISFSTLVMLGIDLILCFFVNSSSGNVLTPNRLLLIALAANAYILFLMNAAGDWSRELGKPYIYLVPESPFRKLIWASMTSVLKPVADGAVIFTAVCIVLRASPAVGFICFLAYASFGFLFTAGNILSQRIFGGMANRGLVAFLYIILLLLLLTPGIGAGIAVYYQMGNSPETLRLFLSGLPAAAWNTATSLVIYYACRNLLSDAEIE